MRRFAQLYTELDRTTRTSVKRAALGRYFADAPPASAAWALHLLAGRRLMRAISHAWLRVWAAEEAGVPLWLLDESHEAVGDLSETIALLLPWDGPGTGLPLHELIEQHLLPLERADEQVQRAGLAGLWRACDRQQRFLVQKFISGTFRVGVAHGLVVRALAEQQGLPPPVVAHRMMGHWRPTPADYARITAPEDAQPDSGRPYPFFLAHPLEQAPADLGDPNDWLAEWKWDGVRAQLIRRAGETLLWSRGEGLINAQFPELVQGGRALPDGTVLDGEILAWEHEQPLPFAELQKRLGRKHVTPTFWPEVPIVYLAFDLLERGGADLRACSLDERRAGLAEIAAAAPELVRMSPEVPFAGWDELAAAQQAARLCGAEGLMLKRRAAAYGVGRPRGDWWKWKLAPHTIDAVLIYAQPGTGQRATRFTDYTFGVWQGEELVPVAKAYSGLTNEEIGRVDSFVRRNTLARRGPVRIVRPELVFELAFQSVQVSGRHRAGLALRFPRMARWRHDKQPRDANTLDDVRALLPESARKP